MAKATFDKYVSWRQANSALTEVEEKIQSEQQKSKDLKKEIDEIRSEEYIERVTKERLNLVKPGEKVIYVLPETPAEQEESNEEIKTNEGLWEKIKGIFVK
ncbi:MAG TPA: septum formation initiator family protein [Candidatus Pacearchaeota archaeon]|nr:septum formation initiator family protein [Candidatus Pacearchaeota archaeon]